MRLCGEYLDRYVIAGAVMVLQMHRPQSLSGLDLAGAETGNHQVPD